MNVFVYVSVPVCVCYTITIVEFNWIIMSSDKIELTNIVQLTDH